MDITAIWFCIRYELTGNTIATPINEKLLLDMQKFSERRFIDREFLGKTKTEFYEAIPKQGITALEIIRLLAPWVDSGERIVLEVDGVQRAGAELIETYREGKRRRKKRNKLRKKGKKVDF